MRALALILLTLAAATAPAAEPIKVACVGNSITYGLKLPDRETQCYPAQLQAMLGDGYEVGNFGRSGATLLRRGHHPYNEQVEYQQAIDFAGDIVVIHLGVNDTDPRDWPNYGDDFVADYLRLIDDFRQARPGCRIIIAKLTPILSSHLRFESGTRDWRDEIQNAIATVARVAGVQVVDFDSALRPYPATLPDAVHPNPQGARILAATVYSAITGDYGGLSLPPVYTSGMVLQRDTPLRISGTADAGSIVTVTIAEQATTAVTGLDGQWSVTLLPLSAGGPYTLTVSDSCTTIRYEDVLAGEVWLCSGQSNMEFTLGQAATGDEDLPASACDNLRLLDMKARWRTDAVEWEVSALDSLNGLHYFAPARWEKAAPSTASRFSAVAYYFGKMLQDSLNVPIGLICNAVGGSPAEAWIERRALERGFPAILHDWRHNDFIQQWVRERASQNIAKAESQLQRHPYEPSYLFDAGIRALGQYPIKGVVWYQGESNAHNADTHSRLFKLLVDNWRDYWDDSSMPFYYVQLSSIDRPSWPRFRDSQRRLLDETQFTAMAVSSDLGDSLDVHPRHKKPIGQRLARLALNKTYNMKHVTATGPMFKSAQYRDGAVYISFENGEGMCGAAGEAISGFELAQEEGLYHQAQAEVTGDLLKVYSPEVSQPRHVRYAWEPFTRANLVNSDGLPASTFKASADGNLLKAASVDVMQGFPDDDADFAKGVSACIAGTVNGQLIIAGGCNFPDKPAREGGKKRYYDAIYAADILGDTALNWTRIGTLPQPVAYGVAIATSDGIVCAGGNNDSGPLTDVFRLHVGGGKVTLEELPHLPQPIDNASGCIADGVLYIAGGNCDGQPSSGFYCLSLDNPDKGWRQLPDIPGNPRTQPVCAAQRNSSGEVAVYLWGGFAGKGEGRDASLEVGGYCFSPSSGKWTPLPPPTDETGETVSLGGGGAVAWGNSLILCAGGVNKDIFLSALQNQAPDYMFHPAEWYRLNTRLLAYNTINSQWQVVTSSSLLARAGAALVACNGYFFCINGELKPGVRTPIISRVTLK